MGDGDCERMNRAIINTLKTLHEKYKNNRKNHTKNSLSFIAAQSSEQLVIQPSCNHLNFRFRACLEQGVPWHSGNYRVWIHSETRT